MQQHATIAAASAATATDVVLRRVRKRYGELEVLHGIDLAIAPGEFVVFVGPSGCGKSTLLRMIAGLERISAGDLLLGGQRMNDVPPARRGIAMVFQSYALYPHMSVYQNLAFGLETTGLPRAEIRARVERAAEILRIEPLLRRRPKALSGGQRQRVAIGRAIVREPSLFLFDEPLSNLDAELRVQMRVELMQLHRRLGTTMIYVTHDQVEAMTMADSIVVLEGGRIQQAGPPLDLYNRPVNRFVAGFIGSPKMNFLPGRVVAADAGGVQVDLGGGAVTVPGAIAAVGEAVECGIRPEHVAIAPAEGTVPLVGVRVDLVENLGGQTVLHASGANGATLTLALEGQLGIVAGDALTTHVRPGQLHLFGADGRRL